MDRNRALRSMGKFIPYMIMQLEWRNSTFTTKRLNHTQRWRNSEAIVVERARKVEEYRETLRVIVRIKWRAKEKELNSWFRCCRCYCWCSLCRLFFLIRESPTTTPLYTYKIDVQDTFEMWQDRQGGFVKNVICPHLLFITDLNNNIRRKQEIAAATTTRPRRRESAWRANNKKVDIGTCEKISRSWSRWWWLSRRRWRRRRIKSTPIINCI